MFKILIRKLNLVLGLTVLTIMLLLVLLMYFSAQSIIRNDYLKKTAQLTRQYTDSFQFKMDITAQTADVFASKSPTLREVYLTDKGAVYTRMGGIKSYNLNIRGTAFVTPEGEVFSDESPYIGWLFSNILKYPSAAEWYAVQSDNAYWQLISVDETHRVYPFDEYVLLYVMPVLDNGEIYGYMILHVNTTRIFNEFSFKNNDFLRNSRVILTEKDNQEFVLYKSDMSEVLREKISVGDNNSYYISENTMVITQELKEQDIKLIYCVSLAFIQEQSRNMILLLLASFVILMTIYFVMFKYVLKGIIDPLTSLHADIKQYIGVSERRKQDVKGSDSR